MAANAQTSRRRRGLVPTRSRRHFASPWRSLAAVRRQSMLGRVPDDRMCHPGMLNPCLAERFPHVLSVGVTPAIGPARERSVGEVEMVA